MIYRILSLEELTAKFGNPQNIHNVIFRLGTLHSFKNRLIYSSHFNIIFEGSRDDETDIRIHNNANGLCALIRKLTQYYPILYRSLYLTVSAFLLIYQTVLGSY